LKTHAPTRADGETKEGKLSGRWRFREGDSESYPDQCAMSAMTTMSAALNQTTITTARNRRVNIPKFISRLVSCERFQHL
jgi:hypothetical protein